MNKNAPMVQEYVLGAAAPHFYYPPGTRLIEEIWYDTDDDEEELLNNGFRDALISAEIVDQLVTAQETIQKARGHAGITGPGWVPEVKPQTAAQKKKKAATTTVNRYGETVRQGQPGVAGAGVSRPGVGGMPPHPRGAAYATQHPGTPRVAGGLVNPASPYATPREEIINPTNPLAYAGGLRMRQAALRQGYTTEQASEMGDAAYYQLRSAEDRVGRNRAGRLALAAGVMSAAAIAPELIPGKSNWGNMARAATILGVAGTTALAESGLPDGAIRGFVTKKILGKDPKGAMVDRTDNMLRRYGGVAHTPERDLLELAAQRTPTSETQRKAMKNLRKDTAREHALAALDVPEDVRNLYKAMGSTPPSKGYITSSKTGRVLAHATGNTADYFVPFTMKQMAGRGKGGAQEGTYKPGTAIKGGLRGNDYIRSRSQGGLTAEDIRTGLVFGARKAEVIGPNGAEWIKFTEKAQKPTSLIPGKNLHISRIPKQYDAVKNAIANNPELAGVYGKDSRAAHNAAVAYLAWKNPKYVEGPKSTASPKPMKGTKAEQTPYVPPGDVTSSATYGQVRAKVNRSLGGTRLPDSMGTYEGPDRKTTLRGKAAKVTKPGIDHARKLGAHGAVTALRAGKAKDRAAAKKIIAESGLYEEGRFVTTQERRERATAARQQAELEARLLVQENDPATPYYVKERLKRERLAREAERASGKKPGAAAPAGGSTSTTATAVRTAAASNPQEAARTATAVAQVKHRGDDWKAARDIALQRGFDRNDEQLLKSYPNADVFVGSMLQSAKAIFEKRHGEPMSAGEVEALETEVRAKYGRRTQEIRERKQSSGNPTGLSGKIRDIPRADIDKRVKEMLNEMAAGKGGHPSFPLDTEAGYDQFVAYATNKIMGTVAINKNAREDINAALNQVASSAREHRGLDGDPEEARIAAARQHYSQARAADRAGGDNDSFEEHKRIIDEALGTDETDLYG